jgi:subtilisin family serine protease
VIVSDDNPCGSGEMPENNDARGRPNETEADRARRQRLSRQLKKLRDANERGRRLEQLERERGIEQGFPAAEPEERFNDVPNGPLNIPAIELRKSKLDTVPVAVVRGEALVDVSHERRDQVIQLLRKAHLVVDETGPDVLRVSLNGGAQHSVADVLAAIANIDELDEDEKGRAHNVSMLRGEMKSTDGPEYADAPPDIKQFDAELEAGVGEGACVVIIDTGLDPDVFTDQRRDRFLRNMTDSHLDPLMVFNEETGQIDPNDEYLDGGAGHGTFVAGIVRAIAPAARVRVLRALDTRGIGTECDVVRAIDEANEIFANECNGRGVLNLSLGFRTEDGSPPRALKQALDRLPENVIVVAAAGNEPMTEPIWPAEFDDVIGVGALTYNDTGDLVPAPWTNTGDHVWFSTVGDGVSSTYVTGKEHVIRDPSPETFPRAGQPASYAMWSGTSFSTPKIAAKLAMLLVEHPTATDAILVLEDDLDPLNGAGIPIPD